MIVDKVEKVNELSLEEIRQKLPDGDDRAYLTENGTRYTVTLHNPTSIPEAAFAACFSLVETNMMKMYKAAECGWSASDKRVEMREPPTRYLIASPESAPDTVAGFVSYQIDWEEDVSVAYCYELQLDRSAQRLGLGRWLMSILEHIGRCTDMEKTMLTVFTANKAALQFYTGIGYEEDETSPQPVKLRSGKERRADYMILSKRLR